MHWKDLFIFLFVTWLVACSAAPPTLSMEWSEKLPMGWNAIQALIIRDVMYFTDFTFGGSQQDNPVIAAFNLTTRKVLWRIERKPRVPIDSDEERLFVVTDKGIEAIASTDGSTLWQSAIVSGDDSYDYDELLSRDGWVFYSDNHDNVSRLYALEAQTGVVVWTMSMDEPIDRFLPHLFPDVWDRYRAVNYDRGRLYVRVATNISGEEKFRFKLIVLDATNGRRLWDFAFETPATRGESPIGASRPVYSEQAVYLDTFGGKIFALQRDTGAVLWEREVNIASPVYINEQIIAISGCRTISTLDAQTGGLKWSIPFMGIGSGPPFIFFDSYLTLYFEDIHRGHLSIVDVKSGKWVLTMQPDFPQDCSTSPTAFALYEEHLYLITLNCIHGFRISR